jgi:hypothetical protein
VSPRVDDPPPEPSDSEKRSTASLSVNPQRPSTISFSHSITSNPSRAPSPPRNSPAPSYPAASEPCSPSSSLGLSLQPTSTSSSLFSHDTPHSSQHPPPTPQNSLPNPHDILPSPLGLLPNPHGALPSPLDCHPKTYDSGIVPCLPQPLPSPRDLVSDPDSKLLSYAPLPSPLLRPNCQPAHSYRERFLSHETPLSPLEALPSPFWDLPSPQSALPNPHSTLRNDLYGFSPSGFNVPPISYNPPHGASLFGTSVSSYELPSSRPSPSRFPMPSIRQ